MASSFDRTRRPMRSLSMGAASADGGHEASDPPSVVPRPMRTAFAKLPEGLREWLADPDFSIFFVAFMLAAAALYLRLPSTVGKFVFDEQEAILANPFVRGQQPWLDAFKRDFWGLLPDRSIGSYRPIPNLLWRALWRIQNWRASGSGTGENTPFVWFNIVFHATNASLLAGLVRGATRRVGTAWFAGALFCASAIVTEAVSGIVGIADVLGGLSLLLSILALRLPLLAIAPVVFATTLFGLLSKESAVVNVGLVPLAALLLAPALVPEKPRGFGRAVFAMIGALVALAAYLYIRHRWFHVELVPDPEAAGCGKLRGHLDRLRVFVGAPNLPIDYATNNPLADPAARIWKIDECRQVPIARISGALRVYFRGLVQVLVPTRLSPDYSYPQEPLPDRLVTVESALGALLLIGPPIAGLVMLLRRRRDPRTGLFDGERALIGYGLIAWPAAFFPISNIPKALPTVRAERFWYTPTLAIAVVVAILLLWLARRSWPAAIAIGLALLGFQGLQARRHANDFRDDLTFWKSAAEAVPNSAKAHLNYSVMLGARAPEIWQWSTVKAQEARLVENLRAAELAPKWDMATIYVGDTLCQLNRMDEAWTWYAKGFRLAPQNSGLIALALQCMSDKGALLGKADEALALADEPQMVGSWVRFLVHDTVRRERECRGVAVPDPIDPTGDDASIAAKQEVDPVGTDTAAKQSSAAKQGGDLDSTDAIPSVSTSPSGAIGSNAIASTQPVASSSASIDPRNAIGSTSIGATGSATVDSGPVPSKGANAPAAKGTPPPCGVDPKYRPRSLDGDPKGD
jgi:hypothetical protein